MAKTKITIDLSDEQLKIIDKIALKQNRTRKNTCETLLLHSSDFKIYKNSFENEGI